MKKILVTLHPVSPERPSILVVGRLPTYRVMYMGALIRDFDTRRDAEFFADGFVRGMEAIKWEVSHHW